MAVWSRMKEEPEIADMSDKCKQFVRDFIKGINSHDPSQLTKPWAESVVIHAGAGVGDFTDIATLQAFIGGFWKAVPDLRVEVLHLICEGDLVAARLRMAGTNTGAFAEGPGSGGTEVVFTGMAFYRCSDEGIVEDWFVDDLLNFLMQLGAVREDILSAPFGKG